MFPDAMFAGAMFPHEMFPPVIEGVTAPSPAPGPMGPAGGPLERDHAQPYDDTAAKRHAKIIREDEEILELVVQIVTKGMLD